MRHFTFCKNCKNKIYINTNARVRSEIPTQFSLRCFSCDETLDYSNFDVIAESGILNKSGGALLGAILGLAAGSGGLGLLGAILGGLLGESNERVERDSVEGFNNS